MSLKITMHSGNCCAIKTISGFGYTTPESVVWKKKKTEPYSTDRHGGAVSSNMNFYHPERPKETMGERFIAYMDFLRVERPQGLVEVCIVPYSYEVLEEQGMKVKVTPFQDKWVPFLEQQGFTRVARVANSNSGNYVEVWHYIMKEEFDYRKAFMEELDDDYDDCYDDEEEYV